MVQVLTIAVLSILITAPIGAAAIMLTAPRLLSKSGQAEGEAASAAKEATERWVPGPNKSVGNTHQF